MQRQQNFPQANRGIPPGQYDHRFKAAVQTPYWGEWEKKGRKLFTLLRRKKLDREEEQVHISFVIERENNHVSAAGNPLLFTTLAARAPPPMIDRVHAGRPQHTIDQYSAPNTAHTKEFQLFTMLHYLSKPAHF